MTNPNSGISRKSSGTAGDPIYAFSKGHEVSGIKARKVLYLRQQKGVELQNL